MKQEIPSKLSFEGGNHVEGFSSSSEFKLLKLNRILERVNCTELLKTGGILSICDHGGLYTASTSIEKLHVQLNRLPKATLYQKVPDVFLVQLFRTGHSDIPLFLCSYEHVCQMFPETGCYLYFITPKS
jgi:hypothetical protein